MFAQDSVLNTSTQKIAVKMIKNVNREGIWKEAVMHGLFQHILSASGLTEPTKGNKSPTTHCTNVYTADDK